MKHSESKKRKFFIVPDILVLGTVLLCAVLGFVLLFFPKSNGELYAEIKVHGELYESIRLSQVQSPYNITVEGDVTVVIAVTSQGVSFRTSECPDKLCVHRGVVYKSGESAVCLPAAVSVRLVSRDSSPSVDAVAG